MEKIVKPYQQEGSKKKQVSNMFDNIAPYYDFLNPIRGLKIMEFDIYFVCILLKFDLRKAFDTI